MLKSIERKLDKAETWIFGAATPEEVLRQFRKDKHYFEVEKRKAMANGDRKTALMYDKQLALLTHREGKLKYSQALMKGSQGKKMYNETIKEQTEELQYLYEDDTEYHQTTVAEFNITGDLINSHHGKEFNDGDAEEEEEYREMVFKDLPPPPTHLVRVEEEEEEDDRVFIAL
jgi:hypothetical protein